MHVFNRWQWASAVFEVPVWAGVTLPADALSVHSTATRRAALPGVDDLG